MHSNLPVAIMGRGVFACFAVLLVMTTKMEVWRAEASISCIQVVAALTPCMNYVRTGGETVPPECCNGARQVAGASKADIDLQATCECVKQLIKLVPGVNETLINNIPEKCGVSLPIKLSPSLDCSKVHW